MVLKLNKLCYLFFKQAKSFDSFDFDIFKKINNQNERLEYAEKHLKPVDEYGSSRAVFILDNKYALKIALPDNLTSGINQNLSEVEISSAFPHLTTKTFEHHPKYYWVITELAKPLDSQEELLIGLNLTSPLDLGLLFGKFPPKNHVLKKEPNPIALEVSQLVKEKILPRDVLKSDSWGWTLGDNKRLILIDYGRLQ